MDIKIIQGNQASQNAASKERIEKQQGAANDTDVKQRLEMESKDEYISSRMEPATGLYRLSQDENGNPKILYEDPKKQKGEPENKNQEAAPASGAPGKPEDEEECTANTDQVDREIEKLKTEKKQLEQQIKAARGDEKKTAALKQQLQQVEQELSQKNNDGYRRQHTSFS